MTSSKPYYFSYTKTRILEESLFPVSDHNLKDIFWISKLHTIEKNMKLEINTELRKLSIKIKVTVYCDLNCVVGMAYMVQDLEKTHIPLN